MLVSVLNWLKHVLPSLILFFCRLLQSFKIFHGFVSKREMIRLKMSPQFFRLHVFTAKCSLQIKQIERCSLCISVNVNSHCT